MSRATSRAPRDIRRAFQRGNAAAVENARGNAHHVLRRRADLRTDDIVSVIKADEIALEVVGEKLFQFHVMAVDDHAVGNARREILNVPRAYPNRDLIFGNAFFDEDLRKPFARFHLDALHAEHKGLIRHVECFYLVDKAAHALRTDGNDDDIRVTDRLFQIRQVSVQRGSRATYSFLPVVFKT